MTGLLLRSGAPHYAIMGPRGGRAVSRRLAHAHAVLRHRGMAMVTRPTGAVTFLFTDIEGSTALWEHAPHVMAAAFARHEAILREAIAAHDGWAYKQIGDAFQAAFQSAPAALAAAVVAQRALAREPWPGGNPLRVRMALHTGVTEERADDYVGPLLNRLARLLTAGHGGQILLTVATYELVREHLPDGVELRTLGERHLRDLLQ